MHTVENSIFENVAERIAEAERPHSNLKSFERCYRAFDNPDIKSDRLALELGYFLASWGMMRGSSFLKGCDYTVHGGAVEILTSKTARRLRTDGLREETAPLILDMKAALVTHYAEVLPEHTRLGVTDTLLSKIILVALGVVPAYDRFLRAGLRKHGFTQSFSQRSLGELIRYADRYRTILEQISVQYEPQLGFRLPYMRILDMHFFTEGKR